MRSRSTSSSTRRRGRNASDWTNTASLRSCSVSTMHAAIRELVADGVATRAAARLDLKRLHELSEVIGLVSHFANDVVLVHVQKNAVVNYLADRSHGNV